MHSDRRSSGPCTQPAQDSFTKVTGNLCILSRLLGFEAKRELAGGKYRQGVGLWFAGMFGE
jgi:hypothetical protein